MAACYIEQIDNKAHTAMNLKSLLRPAAVLLAATALAGCLDVDQKIVVDKGELAYTAQISVDAKLAAMSDKKGGICGGFGAVGVCLPGRALE